MKTVSEHNPILKSTDRLQAIMTETLAYAKQQGASDAAVSVHQACGFSVDVRMGAVETVAFNDDQGVDVTIYHGHRKGSASSSDTSSAALQDMVAAALGIAKVSAVDPCFGLADPADVQFDYPDLALSHPWQLTPQQAIEQAMACEQHALSLDSRLVNSDGVSVSTHTFYSGFATSQGFMGLVPSSRHGVSCSLVAKQGEDMQRDYEYTTARCADDLWPLNSLAERAVERVTARLGARPIKTQKTPVIFSSRVAGGVFSALIAAISGQNLYRKQSFLLDALGQAIFPAYVNVHEQPHLLGALGSTPFDDEGVVTRANRFVVDGMLNHYVLGNYSARKLGLKTTANSGGVYNLTVNPTAGGLAELLQHMGQGLLITELMGQGINGLTGDYSRGASGFWVEQGCIAYPVQEITVAGNLKDMFQQIVAVGDDRNPNSAMRCGSVLIANMMIAGL